METDVKETPVTSSMVLTEDTGKAFEMAICLALQIPYDGPYKYAMDLPQQIAPRLSRLVEWFPSGQHTAKKGARYDFTSGELHLSAKSTKKGVGKVAPQVIGQSQPKKFCEVIGIEYTSVPDLKKYIQTNILDILPVLVSYTFDCPTVYYNHEENTIRYITLTAPIDWTAYSFVWTCDWTAWNNSSTLKIVIDGKEYALLEFQFHTKSRTNMAVRWVYENFLTLFPVSIVHL